MDNIFLKILSDVNCVVYIDNAIELLCKSNDLTKVSLSKGSYRIKCVCDANHNYQYEEIVTIHENYVLRINFKDIIDSQPDLLNDGDLVFFENENAYVNNITGNPLSSEKYGFGGNFKFGLASVERGGKMGCIDKTGKEVIPCVYNSTIPFTESLIWIRQGIYWGLINVNGKIVIPNNFDDFIILKNKLIGVRNKGCWGLYDHFGVQLAECQYHGICDYSDEFVAFRDNVGQWCLYNENGIPITLCKYDEINTFRDGLACVRASEGGKYGYIDKQGEEVIDCIYDEACDFFHGLAYVRHGEYNELIDIKGKRITDLQYDEFFNLGNGLVCVNSGGMYGCIDIHGKEVIPCIYEDSFQFNDGIACVKKGGVYGCIDIHGNEVIPCIYDNFFTFRDGLAYVNKKGACGFINAKGEEIIPCIYEYADRPDQEGLISICKSNKWGCVDVNGKEVIPCIYENRICFYKGLSYAGKDGRYGYIDMQGNEVVPCVFDEILQICENVFIAKKSNYWGLISSGGAEITPFQYDMMLSEGGDMILVLYNGRYGIINSQGEIIIPCKYDNSDLLTQLKRSTDEYIRVKQNKRYGLLDKVGNTIIPCRYCDARYFTKSLSRVEIKVGSYSSKWVLIDNCTLEIVSDQYAYISDLHEGVARVSLYDDDYEREGGYIDPMGKLLFLSKGGFRFFNGVAYTGNNFIDKHGDVIEEKNDGHVEYINDELLFYRTDNWECKFVNKAGEDIEFYSYNEYGEGQYVICKNQIFESVSRLYKMCVNDYDYDYFYDHHISYMEYSPEKMKKIRPNLKY